MPKNQQLQWYCLSEQLLSERCCTHCTDLKAFVTNSHTDPADVQCCVAIRCGQSNNGICRHTNQGCPNGQFINNQCPGDNSIKCCMPSASAINPSSEPQPNTCSFYPNCLEAHAKCGPSGYPLG